MTPTGARLPLVLRLLVAHIQGPDVTPKGLTRMHHELASGIAAAHRLLGQIQCKDDVAKHIQARVKATAPATFAALEAEDDNRPLYIGDVHNAYADPSLCLGIALAYVLLAGDDTPAVLRRTQHATPAMRGRKGRA